MLVYIFYDSVVIFFDKCFRTKELVVYIPIILLYKREKIVKAAFRFPRIDFLSLFQIGFMFFQHIP